MELHRLIFEKVSCIGSSINDEFMAVTIGETDSLAGRRVSRDS